MLLTAVTVAAVALLAGWESLLLITTGLAVLVWPLARAADLRDRRRAVAHDRERRWQEFRSVPSPLSAPLRSGPAVPVEAMYGDARLLFVDVDRDTITVDGLLAPAGAGDRPRHPFWLQVRPPAPSWMRAAVVTLVRRWAAQGDAVVVETRPVPGGTQVMLTAGGSRMVLDVEAAGGLVDAA